MSFEGEPSIINILLMGETGVGKSTFINSFANYINHETFDEARSAKPEMVIPTQITVYDVGTKEDRTLTIGSDKNEKQDIGASATQNIQTYIFPIEGRNLLIQMIDTPGIGDTRGPTQDDENFQAILEGLAQMDKLHAICLLMKPNQDRNTVSFSYCVRRLLSQLHKSSCNNIVFIFTNTKGTDYRAGATRPILEKMRDDIAKDPPYAKIPINDENVFCLDNECFKMLLALDYGVQIDKRTIGSCRTSWEIACDENIRFLNYIQSLEPHNVKDTVSVNKIRDLILQLSKPMSDICQMLQDKIFNLKTKEDECADSNQSIAELNKKLKKPYLDLEIISLEKPATVCTSISCVDKVQVRDIVKYKYSKRCHDPCLLGFVTYETIGHWSLTTCSEMNWSFECKHCGCSYKQHMTIFYDTKVVEKEYVDEAVQKNLDSEEEQRKRLNNMIEKIKEEKKELDDEFKFISTCAAKFAYYLQNNALTSSYDHFLEYIHLSLERQRSLGKNANMEVVASLQDMLDRHQQLIDLFKQKKSDGSFEEVNEVTIQKDADQLFKLKHTGPKMKQIFEARKKCNEKSYTSNLKKYISPKKISKWLYKQLGF